MKTAEITEYIVQIVNSDPYARIATDGKTAKEIDKCLKLYAQERTKDCYPKEFLIWILSGGDGYYIQSHKMDDGEMIFKTDEVTAFQEEISLDELFTYWKENK